MNKNCVFFCVVIVFIYTFLAGSMNCQALCGIENVMAAQQVKLALPVFFLLSTNLLLGTFTFYYAVKTKLPCNDTDMELENIPTTQTDLVDLGVADEEFDEEIVLLGTAFGQAVSPTMNVTMSHLEELALTTTASVENLSESADGKK